MAIILDACCGSRMFWFDKQQPDTIYMDNRELSDVLCDGRTLNVSPDVVADFRAMPFEDESFYLVVFDPPHLVKAGEESWLAKKYGKLNEMWQFDIRQGFTECMRVLKPNGTLIFKWNEDQVSLSEVLKAIGYKPLFGNKRSKTHWLVFMKFEEVHPQ
ncbi:class I SAM-dependent methyltransferase [Paenibacillus sp. P46E]|uniref:class I SAM-dependent methyltransferase n=1 Tax=Paenibacillus sp. P46E TaxID=1349436 RepID=UPI00093F4205|nr:class I SAM-dependent methyltransferase [Paenibacillus sp. P46E]OKP95080.1 methyltransferase [Paenibacillus sp. P46E]